MPRIFRILCAMLAVLSCSALVSQAADLQIATKSHIYTYCTDTPDSVTVTVSGLTTTISGFRLALGIEEAKVSLLQVRPGTFMTGCQWEYLSWKLFHPTPITQLPFGGSHITAVLEINGQASATAGHVATCNSSPGQMELVKLNFMLATSNKSNQCAFLPLRFYWRDCRDNVLYSMSGDTAYAANQVSEGSPVPTPLNASFPGFGSPAHLCDSSVTKHYDPSLAALNGGFDLVCVGAEMCTGDVNLNGHSFEVADLVMLQNYLLHGLPAFSPHEMGSIPQADLDGDGIVGISDMTLFVRLVLSD